jgi:hypothetical protein
MYSSGIISHLRQSAFFAGIVFCVFVCSGNPHAAETVIGSVEDVMLLPSGIVLPARIDTGAALTSLDARNIRIIDGHAEFDLPSASGDRRLRLPLVRETAKKVRTPAGRDERPIVRLTICVGERQLRIRATLADRTAMDYPLLVGRNVLKKDMVVNVSKSHLQRPRCIAGK